MPTYARLKDKRIMIIYLDNPDLQFMQVYPISKQDSFDRSKDKLETIPYSDILAKSDVMLTLITPNSKLD